MDVLLRQLRPMPDGSAEYQDTELAADVISIGSGADCTLQLLGEGIAPQHASIRGQAQRASIACRRGCKLSVNGQPTSSATLKPGDVIELGGNRLRWVEPPAGFDVAIELEANNQISASAFEQAFRTDLNATWLSKRAASWVLAIGVLALALLIPYASIAPQRAGLSVPPLLPSDHFWTAGPLTPAHELAAGQRCIRCHQRIFIHVQDEACRDCHAPKMEHLGIRPIRDHIEESRLKLTRFTNNDKQRCAECHREHNVPITGLVLRDNQLCIDCHSKSETALFGALKMEPVTGFASKTHPAFTVALLKASSTAGAEAVGGVLQLDWKPHREPVKSAREQSNLRFSHAQHLDPVKVQWRDPDSDRRDPRKVAAHGEGLGCADCHTLDADGQHFVPITMQRSCGNAGCHDLRFDPNAPRLPHGNPADAVRVIQDYDIRRALDPVKLTGSFVRRRLPGETALPEEVPCNQPALQCGTQRAQAEIERQFNIDDQGCKGCHTIIDTHSVEPANRFVVAPVRLTRDYFPDVYFSHRQHAVQKDKVGDEACLSCHAVKKSNISTDVLIPDLPKCLECHSDRYQTDRATLQCSSCHAYHPKSIIASTREAEVQ